MSKSWYIARVRPGWSRTVRRLVDVDSGQIIEQSKAEAALQEIGVRAYYPRMRTERPHRRTHKIIRQSRPLFTGYIFVDRCTGLSACEAVHPVPLGFDGEPWPVPAMEVERIMRDEADMVFDDTREARIKRKEEGRTRRETIAMTYPPGSSIRITDGPFSGFFADVVSVTGRGHIRAMAELFGRLVQLDLDAGQISIEDRRVAA